MKKYIELTNQTTVEQILHAIDELGVGFIPIVNSSKKLVGIVSDGDVRRFYLNSEVNIESLINLEPETINFKCTKNEIIYRLKKIRRRHIPLVDDNGVLIDVFSLDNIDYNIKHTEVVIMAGGLGTRLGELTKDTPKPMIEVAGKPMLLHIIEQLRQQGFHNITLCVNYKKEKIIDYFGNGNKYGVEIKYIIENQRLGTAGALSMLPNTVNGPFLLVNADVITNTDYEVLINHHIQLGCAATICSKIFKYEIPFGVLIKSEKNILIEIAEKPEYDYEINAGLYVLDPCVIKFIPKNMYFDMPDLIKLIQENNLVTSVYSLDGYWADLGRAEDIKNADKVIANSNLGKI